ASRVSVCPCRRQVLLGARGRTRDDMGGGVVHHGAPPRSLGSTASPRDGRSGRRYVRCRSARRGGHPWTREDPLDIIGGARCGGGGRAGGVAVADEDGDGRDNGRVGDRPGSAEVEFAQRVSDLLLNEILMALL